MTAEGSENTILITSLYIETIGCYNQNDKPGMGEDAFVDHLVGTYIVDHVFFHDETDNEIGAVVHDLSAPENKLSVFIWDRLLPERRTDVSIRGLLSLVFARGYVKRPEDSVMTHTQDHNRVGLKAVVKVEKIYDAYTVFVKTDFSDKLVLVQFEDRVHPEVGDLIHVEGELRLEKPEETLDDFLS